MDLSKAIEPKSDQINADDLLSGSKTIKITSVNLKSGEQPVSVNFEGDNGKPWKPCKSMVRVLVIIWGKDSKEYIGRSLTIYRDDSVTWAGMKVGGIRISHMSHMTTPITMALTATRANKKPYTVKPLTVIAPDYTAEKALLEVAANEGLEEFKQAWLGLDADTQTALFEYKEGLKQQLTKENK